MADFERVLVPGLTHWNHPGFFAYFAITGSAPGVLADFLSAALNQQAMLWRTSPAATELEAVTLGWLRRLIGLPDTFEGVIYDTASIASLHALAAAREAAVRRRSHAEDWPGRSDVPRLRVYCFGAGAFVDRQSGDRDRPGPRIAPQDSGRRRLPDARRRAGRGDRRGPPGRACCRSRSSPRSGRRRRPASIRCRRSPTSARASSCGCTSTPPTPASRRWCRRTRTSSTAPIAPTRWSSTRTSGCSRRSI